MINKNNKMKCNLFIYICTFEHLYIILYTYTVLIKYEGELFVYLIYWSFTPNVKFYIEYNLVVFVKK